MGVVNSSAWEIICFGGTDVALKVCPRVELGWKDALGSILPKLLLAYPFDAS